jgi:predicted Zn-dependent peptidase
MKGAIMDRSIPPISKEQPLFIFPAFERRTLSNGMKILFVHDPSSPLISISLTMRIGAVHEHISGLSRAVAGLMIAGTSTKRAQDISMLIDRLGLSFGFYASWDACECSSIGLAIHTDSILDLMSECLFDSQFPEDEIHLKKELMIAEHEQYAVDPEYLAARASNARMFSHHPYGKSRIGTPSSIALINQDTCKAFHQNMLQTPDAFFTISGNCSPDHMMNALEEKFGHWKPKEDALSIPQASYSNDMLCIIAPKADAVQTALHIAFPSIGMNHPDFPLFRIASTAFGGYFASHINHVLREVHGYTYGAFAQSYGRKGSNTYNIQTQVGNEVTEHSIQLIFQELKTMQETMLEEEECETVMNYLLGTLVQGMETNQQISSRLKMIEFNQLAEDYHKNLFETIAQADRNRVFEIQQQYFDPKHCIISASGSKEVLESILSTYGETTLFQES